MDWKDDLKKELGVELGEEIIPLIDSLLRDQRLKSANIYLAEAGGDYYTYVYNKILTTPPTGDKK